MCHQIYSTVSIQTKMVQGPFRRSNFNFLDSYIYHHINLSSCKSPHFYLSSHKYSYKSKSLTWGKFEGYNLFNIEIIWLVQKWRCLSLFYNVSAQLQMKRWSIRMIKVSLSFCHLFTFLFLEILVSWSWGIKSWSF